MIHLPTASHKIERCVMAKKWLTDWVCQARTIVTVRRESVPIGQARGARLVARGKSRAFDGKYSPLASRPNIGDAAETFVNDAD